MIAIIDYGMGNLRSVEKGFAKVGVDARIINSPKGLDARDAHGIVLPGVGAFRDCVGNLEALGLKDPIIAAIKAGRPFLGICLGLQMLFTESEEFGRSEGLDLFKGKVVRFTGGAGLKIPHMGWNEVKIKRRAPVLEQIPDGASFYFVHSYYVVPEDDSIVATTTDYGIEFVSMIWKDNVLATQFHPEKSQSFGLEILRAFGDFVKKGR